MHGIGKGHSSLYGCFKGTVEKFTIGFWQEAYKGNLERLRYRWIELETQRRQRGCYKCLICDRVLEVFDGSREVAYRLTVASTIEIGKNIKPPQGAPLPFRECRLMAWKQISLIGCYGRIRPVAYLSNSIPRAVIAQRAN